MEEIPDEDYTINGQALPEGVPALLMTNEELEALQKGEELDVENKNEAKND